MDVIADLIATVLKETSPGLTSEGKPGKVRYVLDEKVADRVSRQATDLVAGFPLYSGIDLG
jgi:glycine hydroxymethyltransferase